MKRLGRNSLVRAWGRLTSNQFGWHTQRKILVIESDDWGSARIPHPNAPKELARIGIEVAACPYLQFDCLEGDRDLDALGSELTSFVDSRGQPLTFTANYNVANPNFDRMREAQFWEYHFEPFTDSIKRYQRSLDPKNKIKQLVDSDIWCPQSHGREHINLPRWLSALQMPNSEVRAAAEVNVYGLSRQSAPSLTASIGAAFDADSADEVVQHIDTLRSGLEIFRRIFGFSSTSFIAPCYVLPSRLLATLTDCGVLGMQGLHLSVGPVYPPEMTRIRRTGEFGHHQPLSLVRNVRFEPSLNPRSDVVDNALRDIEKAFTRKKPAIICSHRVNYMGGVDPDNRGRGLYSLKTLISRVQARWPEVEFMSTPELINVITADRGG
ncbi:hypothetical protein V6X63_09965 [Spiribacter sp. 221]|uniref:hypothetical protein n=1 Tax=Spiribacter onubensis TaxID=3122420 RepID=UPI00349F5887